MAPWLTALATLPDELGLIPNTPMMSHDHLLQFQGIQQLFFFFWPPWVLHTWCIDIRQQILIYNNKIKNYTKLIANRNKVFLSGNLLIKSQCSCAVWCRNPTQTLQKSGFSHDFSHVLRLKMYFYLIKI